MSSNFSLIGGAIKCASGADYYALQQDKTACAQTVLSNLGSEQASLIGYIQADKGLQK